jgi:hypothetical protein
MKMRGKILREPNAGPGLLMIDGQQYRFSLEGIWKSEMLPKPGLTVEAEMNQALEIVGITAVPESQLAKEQAEAAMAKAKEKGGEILNHAVSRFGARDLSALGLLAMGWFLLTTVAIALPGAGSLNFTFWQVLGLMNAGNAIEVMGRGLHPSAGIYGGMALMALAGPFVHHFWKDKWAVLGGLAPLLLMLIVWAMARNTFQSAFGGYGDLGKQAQAEAMQAVSLGLGAYLSGLMSMYFAGMAAKKYLAGPVASTEEAVKINRAAA